MSGGGSGLVSSAISTSGGGVKYLTISMCSLWMSRSVSLRISSAVSFDTVGMGYCCTCVIVGE